MNMQDMKIKYDSHGDFESVELNGKIYGNPCNYDDGDYYFCYFFHEDEEDNKEELCFIFRMNSSIGSEFKDKDLGMPNEIHIN